jgi:hypothetical protein
MTAARESASSEPAAEQGSVRSYFQIGRGVNGQPYWRVQVQSEDNSTEAIQRAFTLAVRLADELEVRDLELERRQP